MYVSSAKGKPFGSFKGIHMHSDDRNISASFIAGTMEAAYRQTIPIAELIAATVNRVVVSNLLISST